MAFLLVGLVAQGIHAQAGSTVGRWNLGISRFYMVSLEALETTASSEFTIEKALDLAAESKDGPLSLSLPVLLASALTPLPFRFSDENAGATSASIPSSLSWESTEPRFIDLREGETSRSNVEGWITGFYTLHDEAIECRILFFEKENTKAVGSVPYQGTIALLEEMAWKVLPAIHAWVANRAVGVVDIKTNPAYGAILFITGNAESEAIQLTESRIFVFEKGDYSIKIIQKGFKEEVFPLPEVMPGSYMSPLVELTPLVSGAQPGQSIAEASIVLDWKEKSAFLKAGKKFQSALGRFVISIPFSAIAAGTFYSFWEAFSRGAASEGALYGSGAAAAISIAFSTGFIIDTGFRLVDVLHASR